MAKSEEPQNETQFPGLKDDSAPDVGAAPPTAQQPPPPKGAGKTRLSNRIAETPPTPIMIPKRQLQAITRRDFLLYGAGAALAAGGFYWLLPPETQARLGWKHAVASPRKERLLNKSLSFDDDVAKALSLPHGLVPTYDKSLALTPQTLRNNYDGQTPDPDYLEGWKLTLSGLASGRSATVKLHELTTRFPYHEQVTRLVCVEGWSAIAWWGGLRFADFLLAYPPMPGARWARLDSSVNLDSDGNADPYYVSLDLAAAAHPQTLLATQQSGQPLTVEHGAPLRLIAPTKLGLKNIKAITGITYTATEPLDYWSDQGRGYSHFDGL